MQQLDSNKRQRWGRQAITLGYSISANKLATSLMNIRKTMKKIKSFYKQPKYKNSRCACSNGHIHMSRLEAGHCNKLHLLKKELGIKDIKTQHKFEYKINDILICYHYADFFVEYKNGVLEVIESKGMETDVWRLKHRLFLALYPDIKYTIWKKP